MIIKAIVLFVFLFQIHFLQALTVTSLNIKWFGLGGKLEGVASDEYRTDHLLDFVHNQFQTTDVFVFQEIINKELFYKIMQPYQCLSYEASGGKHQYVVICYKGVELVKSFVNKEVQLKRFGLRAAMGAVFKEGNELIQVVGVHLKAGKRNTQTRIAQINELTKDFNGNDLSTVLIGDFNTYKKESTLFEFDDDVYINIALGAEFKVVADHPPTYFKWGGRYFDRVWLRHLNLESVQVKGPCDPVNTEFPYLEKGFYNHYISDHCALTVKVKK